MAISWEISSLKVETSRPGYVNDSLFANGLMQVPVYVFIVAKDPDTGDEYKLSAAELDEVRLVEYHFPEKLPDGWEWDKEPNEFDHYAPGTLGENRAERPSRDDSTLGHQILTCWVRTERAENRSLAAWIQQPDGTIVHTAGEGFESRVTLTGMTPARLYRKDLIVDVETVGFSSWALYYKRYYVSSTRETKLMRFEIHEYHGAHEPNTEQGKFYCFDWINADNYGAFRHIWPLDAPQTVEIGQEGHYVELEINGRKDDLCITAAVVYRGPSDKPWDDSFRHPCWFTAVDRYGNSSDFYVEREDPAVGVGLIIKDR
ncbi:hypothetical protein P168DRAFT_321843 [Aspergillus campestris IBT 28561]|uniref:Uncharacterized protein n=1 Tax=Aspergillus campestris (strain IBT 28561) TaxID=1392248 RepID=A0A2I1CT24_ASPC2|nr:uncharacterized protein P168DRAFT_321843 [Aspergillus campestris IBT 28561]PKY00782.1 hypothetical protein P168DRAFT_321843 [Aspergillus campestris IBT 28561]